MVGFEVLEDNELFPDRVCSPCAHKILYELVLSSIGSGAAAFKTPPNQRIIKRIKAAGRNAAGAAVLVASLFVSKASCKSLFASTAQQSQQSLNDCIDSNFNIDDLPTDGALQVKVVIIDKAGKSTTTNPQEEEGKQIVQSREYSATIV